MAHLEPFFILISSFGQIAENYEFFVLCHRFSSALHWEVFGIQLWVVSMQYPGMFPQNWEETTYYLLFFHVASTLPFLLQQIATVLQEIHKFSIDWCSYAPFWKLLKLLANLGNNLLLKIRIEGIWLIVFIGLYQKNIGANWKQM